MLREGYKRSLQVAVEQSHVEEWQQQQKQVSSQFFFWDMILNLELILLSFIRAIRENDFSAYIEVLKAFIPFLFAMDKLKYAKWLSVHLNDLMFLRTLAEETVRQVSNHFTVKKITAAVFKHIHRSCP